MISKHMTNGGKEVLQLQQMIKKLMHIDDNKSVLVTCNGAMGLYALVGGFSIFHGKRLRWAVQAFTFPCSHQGVLMDSLIVDMDEVHCGPSMQELQEKVDDYDGIIVTNCFGTVCDINAYVKFSQTHNKLLLFDNAATSCTLYNETSCLNYGDGCMVSLHHTKPIGFGEGGFIVVDEKYKIAMEQAICFGFTSTNRLDYSKYASNYKMSEIAAVYISNFLYRNFDNISSRHIKLVEYFRQKLNDNGLNIIAELFPSFADYDASLLSCIPVLFKTEGILSYFVTQGIEAKKYYYPLSSVFPVANTLFKRIVCLPLSTDMLESHVDTYIDIIHHIKSIHYTE
jgi:dTDP-4-amino-4,6-dideoxygalactose transaminase